MKAKNSNGVYQRGNVWWVDFIATDGRRVRKSVPAATKEEAKRLRSVLVADEARGELRLPSRKKTVLFHDLCDRYLTHQKLHLKPNSLSGIPSQLNRARDFFGNVPVDRITQAQCAGYWDSVAKHYQQRAWAMAAEGKLVRGEAPMLKAKTVNAYLLTLKSLFKYADEQLSILVKNPTTKLKRRKGKSQEGHLITPDEERRLVEAAEQSIAPHLKSVLIVALHTGARREEITQLKWSQADLEGQTITFNETKNDRLRRMPMSDTVVKLLTELRERTGGCEYVFDIGNGKPSRLERAWTTARKRAGVPADVVFHSLRHTTTSRLVMGGIDLPTVGEMLGNASQLKRYTHLTDEHKRKAIKVLDAAPEGYNQDTVHEKKAAENAG